MWTPHHLLRCVDAHGSAIPLVRPLLVNVLLVRNVLYNVSRPVQSLGICVGNLEAKLILHGHDDLHMIERVQAQIIYEMRISRQLKWGNAWR